MQAASPSAASDLPQRRQMFRWMLRGRRRMLLAIMQQIEHRSEADPAETTFDATDEKVLGQLNARLA
jgi:hypothetical protein